MHRELAFAFHHIKMVLPRCWLHTAMAPADFSRQALLRFFRKKIWNVRETSSDKSITKKGALKFLPFRTPRMKEGGFLLSRIALQYHRRRRA